MSVLRSNGVKSTLASFVEVVIFFCVLTPIFMVVCYAAFHLIHGPLIRKQQAAELTGMMETAERAAERQIEADEQRGKIPAESELGEEVIELATLISVPEQDAHKISQLLHRVDELARRKLRTDADELKTATEYADETAQEAAEAMLADLLDEALVVYNVSGQVNGYADQLNALGQLHIDAQGQARTVIEQADLKIARARVRQALIQTTTPGSDGSSAEAVGRAHEQIASFVDATKDRIAQAEDIITLAEEALEQQESPSSDEDATPAEEPTTPAEEPTDPAAEEADGPADAPTEADLQDQADKAAIDQAKADIAEVQPELIRLTELERLIDLIAPLAHDEETAAWAQEQLADTRDRLDQTQMTLAAAQATIDEVASAKPDLLSEPTPREIIAAAKGEITRAQADAVRGRDLLALAAMAMKADRSNDDLEWLKKQAESSDKDRSEAETEKADAEQLIADLLLLSETLAPLVEALGSPRDSAAGLFQEATTLYEAIRDLTTESVDAAKAAAAKAEHATDDLKENRLTASKAVADAADGLRSQAQSIAELASSIEQQAAATYEQMTKTVKPELDEFVWNIRRATAAAARLARRAELAASYADALDRSRVEAGQSWGESLGQGLGDIRIGRCVTSRRPFINAHELFGGMPWWIWVIEGLLYALFITGYWSPGEKPFDKCELQAFALFALAVVVVWAVTSLDVIGQQMALILRIATGQA